MFLRIKAYKILKKLMSLKRDDDEIEDIINGLFEEYLNYFLKGQQLKIVQELINDKENARLVDIKLSKDDWENFEVLRDTNDSFKSILIRNNYFLIVAKGNTFNRKISSTYVLIKNPEYVLSAKDKELVDNALQQHYIDKILDKAEMTKRLRVDFSKNVVIKDYNKRVLVGLLYSKKDKMPNHLREEVNFSLDRHISKLTRSLDFNTKASKIMKFPEIEMDFSLKTILMDYLNRTSHSTIANNTFTLLNVMEMYPEMKEEILAELTSTLVTIDRGSDIRNGRKRQRTLDPFISNIIAYFININKDDMSSDLEHIDFIFNDSSKEYLDILWSYMISNYIES